MKWRVAGLLALAGCGSDLPSVSTIEKLRVLAVRAEPPEVAPGQTAALDVLTAQPPVPQLDGAAPSPLTYLWLACQIPPETTQQLPCGLQRDQRVTSVLPPSCNDRPGAPLCLIGLDPTGSFTPDATPIGDDGTGQMLITVVVADTTEGAIGCLMSAAQADGMPQDPDHCILTLKRLSVTDPARKLADGQSPLPNQNPTLDDFTLQMPSGVITPLLDGTGTFTPSPPQDAPTGELLAVRSASAAEREPNVDPADGAFKGYQYESLTVSWFITAGKLSASRFAFRPPGCATQTDCPDIPPPDSATTRWTPPTSDAKVHFYAVIRDDRGGVGWLQGTVFGSSLVARNPSAIRPPPNSPMAIGAQLKKRRPSPFN